MTRADRGRGVRAAALAAALGCVLSGAAPSSAAEPPVGASALDAWARLREAESRTYRLPEDGVHRFSCRVRSPFLEKLTARGGPLAGGELDVRLHWQEGLARATVECPTCPGGLDPDLSARIASLVEPLTELLFAEPQTRTLQGSSFRFVSSSDGALRPGETGIEATSRREGDSRTRAVVAIGPDGLVTSERHEWRSGPPSEFRHAYRLSNGRWLPLGFDGTWHGGPVAIRLEWTEAKPPARPMPTKLVIRQDGEEHDFTLDSHEVNGVMPRGLFPVR